ncbi:hypothetical protein K457DRAFT_133668 [Linnemannia elongata AG-77]|uniref:Uncharacterized protein n=1 Tax=Linnemannia elongata AG-77 TaxID=1314771 RepID=A0A197K8U4_9FUNG|nr:hypothetical protein K457DRAFT_133668 [Linnemannia elongata AG-77]
MRSCVCLNCGRWLHRDAIGAQNIAAAGETWIKTFTRPLPLCRTGQSPETPYLHNSN